MQRLRERTIIAQRMLTTYRFAAAATKLLPVGSVKTVLE